MLAFAAIVPHPPLLLPSIGSIVDRQQVKKTLMALEVLAKKFKKVQPEVIIISSPHQDWGFDVPLYFLAKNFEGEIKKVLTDFASPRQHFEKGQSIFQSLEKNKRYAFIASGDLSHCLRADGPYGFNPDGPRFDEALQKYLLEKNKVDFLKLNESFPEAGECGLRSFSFLWGVLEATETDWQVEILSYEKPFGVGYLVANFLI